LARSLLITLKKLDAEGTHAQEIARFERHAAVEIAPDQAAYIDTLAVLLYRTNQVPEAIAPIKKAIRLEPNDKEYPQRLQMFRKGSGTSEK
jgi:hypothetical protein